MSSRTHFFILAIFLPLLSSVGAQAQNYRGSINGTVTDPSEASVSEATIIAADTATGIVYKSAPSSTGEFVFPDLPPGSYKVTVTASGFDTVQIDNVTVAAGAIYTLPVALKVAQSATVIEVSGVAATLDTTTATDVTNIPSEQIKNIPLMGRDFTELIAIAPGFGGYNVGGGGGASSINGTRPNQINWQIEGADNNDPWWNVSSVNQSGSSNSAGSVLPIDAIEQYSFVASSGPETGRSPGGTVNITIKSGTNQLHGSAYYFNRNEFFGANNPFASPGTPKTKERNQNDGFSLGGPIIRNKLFFFVGGEYQNSTIGLSANTTEPSAAYQQAAESVLGYYGVPVNPVSTNLLSSIWPASALIGPAQPGNYFANAPDTSYSYNGLLKIDYNFNDANHLSARGYVGQGIQSAAIYSYLAPFFTVSPSHFQNYSVIYNTIFSPRLTNQVTLGVNYLDTRFVDADTNFDPVGLGLNTGVSDPTLRGSPKISIGNAGTSVFGLSASGFDNAGSSITPSGRREVTTTLNDTLTYVIRSHELRVGGTAANIGVDSYYQTNGRGTFTFDGSQGPWYYPTSGTTTPCDALATRNLGNYAPGYSPSDNYDANVLFLADFMAGCVSNSSIVVGDTKRRVLVNAFNLYAGDIWKATRRLSLNYGLRYDYSGPIHNNRKNLSVFDPTQADGLAVAGSDIANVYQRFWSSYSPRLGFAFQPRADGSLVVRGGVGLYYDTPYILPFLNLRGTANGGALGVQDNPAGANPVAAPSVSSYVIENGQQIFPNLEDAIAGAGVIGVFSVANKFQPSSTLNISFNIQQSLGKSVIAQIGYVGTLSRHLTGVADVNQAAQGSAFTSIAYNSTLCPPQYSGATPTSDGNGQQCSRPYFSAFPNYAVINQVQSEENANYNSLQAVIRTQAWHGLTSQFSYTWSHALDYMTGLIPYLPQDSTNLKAEYGNSDLDTRNNLTGYFSYQVPAWSQKFKRLGEGWAVSGLLTLHGGQPFSVLASTNTSGNGEYSDRADATGISPFGGVSHAIVGGVVQWFNPAAFADPPSGEYGTTRRGQYFNPGFADLDFSVMKLTKITERIGLQLRADMFNLTNRLNLAPAGDPAASDSGGTISSTIGTYFGVPGIGPGEPYNTQFAAKIIF